MNATAVLLTSLALLGCDTGWPSGASDSARSDAPDGRRVEVPVARLASDEARQRGRVVFREHCALCHGERADGRGIRREALSAKPIDFSRPDWRERADPIEIHRVLVEGKRGTSMPAWPTLSEEEKWDVIAYVLRVSRDGP